MLMTYQLPQTWTNVANAWEMTCVQDYVSINTPGQRLLRSLARAGAPAG